MKIVTVLLAIAFVFLIVIQSITVSSDFVEYEDDIDFIKNTYQAHIVDFEESPLGQRWYENYYYNITSTDEAIIRDGIVHEGNQSFGGDNDTISSFNFRFTYMENTEMIDFSCWFFTYQDDINFTFSWKNETDGEVLKFILNNTALVPIYSNGTGTPIYFQHNERGDWKYIGWRKHNYTWSRYYVDSNELNGNHTWGPNIGGNFSNGKIIVCNVTNDGAALVFDDIRYFRTGHYQQPDDQWNSVGVEIYANVYYYYDVYEQWNSFGIGVNVSFTSTPEPDITWTSLGMDIYINPPYSDTVSEQWTTFGIGIVTSDELIFYDMYPVNESVNISRFVTLSAYGHKPGQVVHYDVKFQVALNDSLDFDSIPYMRDEWHPNATVDTYFSCGYSMKVYWRVEAYNATLMQYRYSPIYWFTTSKFDYNTSMGEQWNSFGMDVYVNPPHNLTINRTWTTFGLAVSVNANATSEPDIQWTSFGADIYVNISTTPLPNTQWNSLGLQEYIFYYEGEEPDEQWNSFGGIAVCVSPHLYVDDDYTVSQPRYGTQNFSTISDANWVAHLRAGKFYIHVYNGTYIEWNMDIEKDMDIIGNSSSEVQIWGGEVEGEHIFEFSNSSNPDMFVYGFDDYVNISGMTISGAGGSGVYVPKLFDGGSKLFNLNVSDCYFFYNDDEDIYIRQKNVTLWNNTFYETVDKRTAVFVNRTNDTLIAYNIFVGNGSDYAVELLRAENTSVIGNYINDTEEAIYGYGKTSDAIRNYTNLLNISDNRIYNSDYGIWLIEYENLTLHNNTIAYGGKAGIYLPYNISRANITDCVIAETPRGIRFGGGDWINISGCYIYNMSTCGIDINGNDSWWGGIDNVSINGTVISGGGITNGIRLYVGHPNMDMNHINVSFCNITNCGGYGVYLDDNQIYHVTEGQNSTMQNISIYGSTFWNNSVGILEEYLGGSYEFVPVKNVSINNSEFAWHTAMAIRLEDTNNVYIFSNYIHNTSGSYKAISLYDVNNTNLSYNYLGDNNNGVLFDTVRDFTMFSNQLWDNGFGVLLTGSRDGKIWNNIFNNTVNAYDDDTSTNVKWNTTKTLAGTANIIGGPYFMGNYWNDYAGLDMNWDGIGETPYVVPDVP